MEYIPLEGSKNRTIMEPSEMSCVLNRTIELAGIVKLFPTPRSHDTPPNHQWEVSWTQNQQSLKKLSDLLPDNDKTSIFRSH